jgi:histidinol-phosphatase
VSSDLALALDLADLADSISLARFRAHDLIVETKPDLSPVTEADRAVEQAIRARLAADRSSDGILGEEYGGDGAVGRRWIVDPIDGTRNYSRGVPVWATLIALEQDGVLEVGVVSAPALRRRWWAERGGGAFVDGEPMRASAVGRIEDAVLSFPAEEPLPEIASRCWLARGFGDFWAHMLVAEGAVDGAVDSIGVSVWDLAAVRVIVEEAGGWFSDRSGVARLDGGSAVSSNGVLHGDLLAALATQSTARTAAS